MKLKLDFVTKVPKVAKENEIILVKDKSYKNKILNSLNKSLFINKLFLEKKFFIKNTKDKNYIFVNCSKSKSSLDFEKLGSELYIFLKNNKIEKSFFMSISSFLTNVQLEKLLHGAQLKSYEFNVYKTDKLKHENSNLYVVGKKSKKSNVLRNKLNSLLEGVFLARDLVSEPGNILHPDEYAKRISKLRKFGLKVTVYDKKRLKKMGMNALLGVGQGSVRGSYLVTIEWNGAKNKSKPLGFVGKGVCFDTGGYSLKPAKFMEDMTYDMAGSATVVGLMKTLALRKSKINAVGVVGLVENMVSGNAQRPGDIVKSYSGKTIEVLNTDAEGRLILADALAYASKHYDPEYMLDFATLTGAVVITLGHIATGIMSNNETLVENIKVSSDNTGEHVWQLPLWDEYCDQVKSEVADVKNLGSPGQAGTIAGGAFLKAFVGKDIPWAHFDVAGTSYHVENRSYIQKNSASGQVIRLVLDMLGA